MSRPEATAAHKNAILTPRRMLLPATEIRVLVVDGEESPRQSLKEQLRGLGFEVVAVATCDEAIKSAGEVVYDACVVRLQLTSGDGLSTCRNLVAVNPAAAIIISDDTYDGHQALAAFAAGAVDYVAKNDSHKVLGARIQVRVRIARARAANALS